MTPMPTLELYDLLVDRTRHALQYTKAAWETLEAALALVEELKQDARTRAEEVENDA